MFLNVCHKLNMVGLTGAVAVARKTLHRLCARWACEGKYAQPDKVMGWRGWVSVPMLGVLAFRDEAGQLQYRW